MAILRKFPSLAYPEKYGYAFNSEEHDYKAPIEAHFRMFETYGDGLTQHSGDWSVTSEFLTDYLASLAAFIIGEDETAEGLSSQEDLIQALSYLIANRPNVEQIEFAAGVIYKEGKTRYFSAKEVKVSASPSKSYDKRYEEIRDFHDGSAKSIYRVLIPEYATGLQRYAYASAIRDWTFAEGKLGPYMGLLGVFLEWFKDNDEGRKLKDAYEACFALVNAYYAKHQAIAALRNYKRTLPEKDSSKTEVA